MQDIRRALECEEYLAPAGMWQGLLPEEEPIVMEKALGVFHNDFSSYLPTSHEGLFLRFLL